MPIEIPKPEVFEAQQEKLRAELLPTAPRSIVNTDNVITLGADTRFSYRLRPFMALPLPFRQGAELQKLRLAMIAASVLMEDSESAVDEYAEYSKQAIELIWKVSIPATPIGAIKKRFHLAKNPFYGATDGEVMHLLNFFLRLRMLSSFRR